MRLGNLVRVNVPTARNIEAAASPHATSILKITDDGHAPERAHVSLSLAVALRGWSFRAFTGGFRPASHFRSPCSTALERDGQGKKNTTENEKKKD